MAISSISFQQGTPPSFNSPVHQIPLYLLPLQFVLLARPQHLPQTLVFGDGALALEPLGFHLAVLQVLVDDLECHRHADAAGVVQAVEEVHPLDRAALAVAKMPGDDLVLVAVGLLLDGVIEDPRGVVRLDGAAGLTSPHRSREV